MRKGYCETGLLGHVSLGRMREIENEWWQEEEDRATVAALGHRVIGGQKPRRASFVQGANLEF